MNFLRLGILIVDLNGLLDSFEGFFELLQILLGLRFAQIQLDQERIRILRTLSTQGIHHGESRERLHFLNADIAEFNAFGIPIHFQIRETHIAHRRLIPIHFHALFVSLQCVLVLALLEQSISWFLHHDALLSLHHFRHGIFELPQHTAVFQNKDIFV